MENTGHQATGPPQPARFKDIIILGRGRPNNSQIRSKCQRNAIGGSTNTSLVFSTLKNKAGHNDGGTAGQFSQLTTKFTPQHTEELTKTEPPPHISAQPSPPPGCPDRAL